MQKVLSRRISGGYILDVSVMSLTSWKHLQYAKPRFCFVWYKLSQFSIQASKVVIDFIRCYSVWTNVNVPRKKHSHTADTQILLWLQRPS